MTIVAPVAEVTAFVWRVALRRFLSVRFTIGLIAAAQGYFRLVTPGATASLSYGTSQWFGAGLLLFGLLVMGSTRWHLKFGGRACAAGLCVIYGMLGAAVWHSPASAVTSLVFAVAMLAEAGTYD